MGRRRLRPSQPLVHRHNCRLIGICIFVVWTSIINAGNVSAADSAPNSTVGIPATIAQQVLPGSELEVIPPADKRAPFVLRIAEANPHGTAYRYDLVYYALEPGTYDLRKHLRRKDGSALGELPALEVTVASVLPAGHVPPSEVAASKSPGMGGYRMVLILGGLAWFVGLYAIIFAGRKRAAQIVVTHENATLADRLRPLVEQGLAGTLSPEKRAELERSLIGYWRKRLQLDALQPADAFVKLRNHGEAGPLLTQLEMWLHRPGPNVAVDVAELLKPYQHLPADALESQGSAA